MALRWSARNCGCFTTDAVRAVAELGPRRVLAGPGAWSAGNRLALWDGTDCLPACPASYAGFQLSFVDVNGGAVTGAASTWFRPCRQGCWVGRPTAMPWSYSP